MTIPKLEAVLPLMKIMPVACEMELHPCFQQQELFDYLVAHKIQPVGFMPLGSPHARSGICARKILQTYSSLK